MRSDPVKDYAKKVLDGKIIAGPSVRAACGRHFRDIDTASKRGLWFDLDAAYRVFGFFEECLTLGQSQYYGQPFMLAPHQKFVLGSLFGWKNADGTRRFRMSFDEEAKSNGKTPLGAGIGTYLFCADGEVGAEVYIVGPTKDQARVPFEDMVGFIDRSEGLSSVIRKKGENPVDGLTYAEMNAKAIILSADAKKKSGFRPSCVVVDEVHELGRNEDIIEMMFAGFKFRPNPLLHMITNSGYNRQTACWRWHEYGQKVSAGVESDDTFFAFICDLDKGDDPLKDESVWSKANPLLGTGQTKPQLRNSIKAYRAAGKTNLCLRLNFCVWTSAESAWISPDLWASLQKSYGAEDIKRLRGLPCWGALDLSRVRDLTALTLMFLNEDETIDALSWFWSPLEGIDARSKVDGAPYVDWADPKWEGQAWPEPFLIATPGAEVDYAFVAAKIKDLENFFDIRAIAFDAYEIERMRRALDDVESETPLFKHAQAARMTRDTGLWMPGSINLLESSIYNKKIRIQQNPVMTMCAMSVLCHQIDAQGNRVFSKQKSTGRIDGAVTLAMARGALEKRLSLKKRKSIYEAISTQRRGAQSLGAD